MGFNFSIVFYLTHSILLYCICFQKIDLDTVDYAEDGKRDLISREIGKFREIMKVS